MPKRRKPRISVLLAPGSEETDVLAVTRTLREARFPVVVVGLTANPTPGAHGLSLVPDKTLSGVKAEDFQAVVLPGGERGVGQLNADPRVHAFVRQVAAQGGVILALGEAEQVVQIAGVVADGEMECPVILERDSEAFEAAQTLAMVLET